MIITIDGPAGSGKSTAARKLAARLQVAYLDTGAMYRAIAYKALREHVDLRNDTSLYELAMRADIRLDCGPTHTRVLLDGEDVSEAIRTMEVSEATPFVARHQRIRNLLIGKQRQIAAQLGALVTEGRDQGSVVLPDADVKFVLDATVEKRAQRRYMEMAADGQDVVYEEVLANLTERDNNDRRQWAPLLEPGCAVFVDTTDMTLPDVVEHLLAEVRSRAGARA